jgi:exoribonuclease-2
VSDKISPQSLVLYKIRPAIVVNVSDKIEIRFQAGNTKKVRDKDITLLHPGPVQNFEFLKIIEGNVQDAWELLQGEQASLADVSELIFGEYTPASAWATWEILQDKLYFSGKPERIQARSENEVAAEQAARAAKQAEEKAWDDFLQRVKSGVLEPEDRKRLAEVEMLALGKTGKSRILKSMGVQESPETAHHFLLKCGYWPANFNPWPHREGAILNAPDLTVPSLPEQERLDLTHLDAWAIDDQGNTDPDDAISLDGDRLWVHVADVAALVTPDSHLDLAARERSANLYLPEGVITMLPPEITEHLGLGLQERSPALSFGFRLEQGQVTDIQVSPSLVKVTRTTYDAVEDQMEDSRFAAIYKFTESFRAARVARDAANIDLPEVSVKLVDDEVLIRPLPKLRSRQMVTDAMLMAGEAAARFAEAEGIVIPYATQASPEEIRNPQSMSESYAYRRLFKPSTASMTQGKHFGLGLDYYARATSPLRRYVDLVVHQQLRAHARGETPLDSDRISTRIAEANTVSGTVRRSERLSNQHWKRIFLQRQEKWQGDAVIVALDERKAVVIIPELALESRIRRKEDMQLDQTIRLEVREVDVPGQNVYFRLID